MENCYTLTRLRAIARTAAQAIAYYDRQLSDILPKVLRYTNPGGTRAAYKLARHLASLRLRAISRWCDAVQIAAKRLDCTFSEVTDYIYGLDDENMHYAINKLSTTARDSARYEAILQ